MQEDEEIRDSKQTGGPCAVKLSRLNVEFMSDITESHLDKRAKCG